VIYSAPEAFAKDVPYQTAIVEMDGGSAAQRVTCRILGDRVKIDDRVVEAAVENTNGVLYFRKV